MNGGIQRKLMEVENSPASIEQWYRRVIKIGGRVGGRKKDCEDGRNKGEELLNRSNDRLCHDH